MKKLLLCFAALLLMISFSNAADHSKPTSVKFNNLKAVFNSNITMHNATFGYRNTGDWYCNIYDQTLGATVYSGNFTNDYSNISIDDGDVCDISIVYVGSGTAPTSTFLGVYSNAHGLIGSSSSTTSVYVPNITFSAGDSFTIELDAM
jgi:hypothetical protein